MKKKIYVSNLDSVSAILDRLITEKIKQYFFFLKKDHKSISKQSLIIKKINEKLTTTLKEIYYSKKYEYMSESRTFGKQKKIDELVNSMENLVIMHLNISKADNKLNEIIKNIKLSRNSLEERSKIKNNIDMLIKKLNVK